MDSSEMSFWSLKLEGGAKKTVDIEQSFEQCTYVHITNSALQPNPSDGHNTVSIFVNGEETVLVTLGKVRKGSVLILGLVLCPREH
jgi:hypothetical protein